MVPELGLDYIEELVLVQSLVAKQVEVEFAELIQGEVVAPRLLLIPSYQRHRQILGTGLLRVGGIVS